MKINQNMSALITINALNKNENAASKAMQRLSSGLRINSAKDNAAGLAIANKLDTQARGLKQASRNAMDGISLVQTAEGALNEVSDMLVRLKELVTQAGNGTFMDVDKEAIQAEMDSLIEEINAIQEKTEFNEQKILSGNGNLVIQIGANADENMMIDGEKINLYHTTKYINGLKVDDIDGQKRVEVAIVETARIRGYLGAYQNRLEHTTANLDVSEENMTSAFSRIKDADMAEEMTSYTQYNVLVQAANAMLAQANQRPQQVLQLLNA
ncbi:flagellin N-terminal helical domain-containing protein [Cellulosilyticum ruminicola]|uniref:flagellin N-terminal helical domain-containing protein n=1 Tax=Cellulosilyticum ruminicola TaxID=425254 RepID=UPI0006D00C5B|nr:flagellin [Cellulosilyticum ruminicola]